MAVMVAGVTSRTGKAVTVNPAFNEVVPPPGAGLVTVIFLVPGTALDDITIAAEPAVGLLTVKEDT